ncbi:hypothetical protein BSL78_22482 [Apostichopus japonicus]|uniref:Uncharacterized protein n=1 Tax=Stichopus japonicus TaxID=307972 RepID=A0A2G8JY65_STIJA|nr:hypothetical protein BSL78_22482 [Apostichopus japonicus]
MFVNIWIESPDTDNQLLVVNKDCMIHNLLDYVKLKCQLKDWLYEEGAILDLADEEGNLRHLTRHHPRQNASLLLTNKATYIPIIIMRNEDGSLKPFEPVPTSLKTNREFLSQLNLQFEKKVKPNVPSSTPSRRGTLNVQGKKMKERLVIVDENEDSMGGTKGAAVKKNNTKQGMKGKR